ncbi:MAG: T9SS type A sorting domain-containing protein [bacterium]|jgi:hypothetical protein|nr:T9SS type A sorting domain-containing protein [bacterium]MDD3625408.1 T9SS type A sorting domain-containing protein [Proteiniphilum sp.]MDD3968923.1 T9SS type A sorting domain-containing protein [Proteiniphilum sp.]MDD4459055.1 T9SS type A sorting domain-containing protein [Proteiniphilum sp.]
MKLSCPILLLVLLISTCFPAPAQINDSLTVVEERIAKEEKAGKEQEEGQDIRIRVIGNRLRIENLSKEAILEIYNIMGVKVFSRRIPPGSGEYPVNLTRGYYILKIGKTTKKIAIR